jgi:hypothetical protein
MISLLQLGGTILPIVALLMLVIAVVAGVSRMVDYETYETRKTSTSDEPRQEQPVAPNASSESLKNYERFRKVLYAYAVLTLFLGLATAPIAAIIGAAFWAGLAYWARNGSKIAWGVAMGFLGFNLVILLIAVLAIMNSTVPGLGEMVLFIGLVWWALYLLPLYFGFKGRSIALGNSTDAEPSANTTRSQTVSAGTNAPSSAGRTTVQEGNSSESTGGGATTASSTAVASDVAADASGGQAAEKSAAGADAVDDPSTPDEREGAEAPETTPSTAPEQHEIQPPLSGSGPETTPSTAPEGSSDLASDADSDAGTAPGSGGPSEDVPTVETIADRAASTQDPSDIRDLGERANEEPVPEEAIRALKSCMEAEDPDVRVAVCEACGEIPGEEVESILGRLRIDTNDCVAEAAMDAY